MISVDKIDDGLPISVIVPLINERKEFFNNFTLPLIEANNPNEIIINNNFGSAPKKRNEGFKKATQEYLFFCDDDIILPANYLQTLYNKLKSVENRDDITIGYAYTGYYGIVMYPQSHPMKGNFQIQSRHFNSDALKRGNYISTMSLINRKYFPMFDENLKRLQDWDVFLTMLENGIHGVFIENLKFYAYYLDEGITANTNSEREAYMRIITKHKINW